MCPPKPEAGRKSPQGTPHIHAQLRTVAADEGVCSRELEPDTLPSNLAQQSKRCAKSLWFPTPQPSPLSSVLSSKWLRFSEMFVKVYEEPLGCCGDVSELVAMPSLGFLVQEMVLSMLLFISSDVDSTCFFVNFRYVRSASWSLSLPFPFTSLLPLRGEMKIKCGIKIKGWIT